MQVEAVTQLVKNVSETVLHNCMERVRREHPNATPAEHLAAVTKRVVPATVPGSPAYHRGKLQDLLAMVDSFGRPSLFVTVTADEV